MKIMSSEESLFEIIEYFVVQKCLEKIRSGSFEIPLVSLTRLGANGFEEGRVPVGKLQIDVPFGKSSHGHLVRIHYITWDDSGNPITRLDSISCFNLIDRVAVGAKFLKQIGFSIDEEWINKILTKKEEDEDAEVVPSL